jgi:tyrosyl-tRNA synthetase
MTDYELIKLGTDEIIGEAELKKALASGKTLKIKLGLDPTTADIHLGHAVVIQKLRQFQDLGHQVIFLIGDFTASVGDPSGNNKTRPILSEIEIAKNLETYIKQASKILDTDKAQVLRNSEWLKPMTLGQFVQYTMLVTVNNLVEREDFSKRLKGNQSVSLHEFIYPLLQGIDSVFLKADVEIGGTDQRLNMLMGRELQKKLGQKPQAVITMPLLIGTDGEMKMSKSKGNYIGVDESPNQMFGKLMRIPDSLTNQYGESQGVDMTPAPDSPRDRKAYMAEKIVELFHGAEAAERALDDFDKTFRQKIIAEDLVEQVDIAERDLPLIQIVAQVTGSSGSDARRLIEQNGIKVNGETISDPTHKIHIGNTTTRLQVGKRRFFELHFK